MRHKKLLISSIVLLAIVLAVNTFFFVSLQHKLSLSQSQVSLLTGNSARDLTITASSSSSEQSIPIVAVTGNGQGVVAKLHLKLIPGDNHVLVQTNPFAEPDSQDSLNKAVAAAKLSTSYTNNDDFLFSYESKDATLIGGGSAGAASTVLTIATLEGKPLKTDAIMTGTINADGTIGKIGGLLEKMKAASDAGYKYFLIPDGQATYTTYQKQVTRQNMKNGLVVLRTTYVPQKVDLQAMAQKQGHMQIVEVKTIQDALPYFLDESK